MLVRMMDMTNPRGRKIWGLKNINVILFNIKYYLFKNLFYQKIKKHRF